MTGVEAVGLILGVLPLIIKTVESYEKIGELIGTYRKYSKAVSKFNIELSTQRTIFQNECTLLLSEVVDDRRVLREIFSEPVIANSVRTSLQNNENLEHKLSQRMNERVHDSYKQIAATLRRIGDTLNSIYEETKGYHEQLGDDTSRPSRESTHFRAWAHNVRSKLRFSFEKTALTSKIDTLDRCNRNFLALSRQVSQIKVLRTDPENEDNSSSQVEKGLEEVCQIRKASEGLCEVLNSLWLCPDHADHSANLRLSLELRDLKSIPSSKIEFSVVVTSWAIDRFDGSKKPVELCLESYLKVISDKAVGGGSPVSSGIRQQLIKSINESYEKVSRQSKSVTEDMEGADPVDSAKQGPDQSGERLPLADLCTGSTSLCSHFHKSPDASTLGYLPGFLVHRRKPTDYDFAGATPLALLLSERRSEQRLNNLDKWKLAGALAMAVLQYHSTPWLQETGMDSGILFFKKKPTGRTKSLESPHLQLFHQSTGKNKEVRSVDDPSIKNKTLFQLGMILLELEFEDSLERIAERWQISGSGTQGSQGSQESLAHRLQVPKYHAGENLGTNYGKIVRMCLDCDFGLGLNEYSLDDRQLQKAFYLRIICQFRDLLPSWEKIYGFSTHQ